MSLLWPVSNRLSATGWFWVCTNSLQITGLLFYLKWKNYVYRSQHQHCHGGGVFMLYLGTSPLHTENIHPWRNQYCTVKITWNEKCNTQSSNREPGRNPTREKEAPNFSCVKEGTCRVVIKPPKCKNLESSCPTWSSVPSSEAHNTGRSWTRLEKIHRRLWGTEHLWYWGWDSWGYSDWRRKGSRKISELFPVPMKELDRDFF